MASLLDAFKVELGEESVPDAEFRSSFLDSSIELSLPMSDQSQNVADNPFN
jgi:hypothetical protein